MSLDLLPSYDLASYMGATIQTESLQESIDKYKLSEMLCLHILLSIFEIFIPNI